jgi:uncharacterized protein YdaT
MSRNHHVVPYGDKWAVRREGNTKVSAVYDTKKVAVSNARHIASSTSSEVVIHCSDGRIRSKDTYGIDYFPPRRSRNSF